MGNEVPFSSFWLIMRRRPVFDKAGERQDKPKAVGAGLWTALSAAAAERSAHKSAKAGAAIAYYSIFSIGPLIVVVISIPRLSSAVRRGQREVTEAIRGLLGRSTQCADKRFQHV
jgi:membrane protein